MHSNGIPIQVCFLPPQLGFGCHAVRKSLKKKSGLQGADEGSRETKRVAAVFKLGHEASGPWRWAALLTDILALGGCWQTGFVSVLKSCYALSVCQK